VLAYATTIHKSQGSEYPAVVIPLTIQRYPMLQRNLVYTGVTRGKRLVMGPKADIRAFDPECSFATERVEDPRLLTGQGSFTADRIVPGALHVAFRHSDHAHAVIASISTSAAAEVPGVFAIYSAQDLHDLVEPVRASSRMKNYHATALYPLARDKVRYVGEPVVAVLAENRYLAEDVLDRIGLWLGRAAYPGCNAIRR
jgi:hypothetical protein